MKKILSITLLLCMVLGMMPITASADVVESGTCGESLTWEFDSEGTLTISGEGPMDDYESVAAPWYDIRRDVIKLVINEGVTTIGDYAFCGCGNLVTAEIAEGVTSIGNLAFSDCSMLMTISMPKTVEALGENAFYYCQNLKAIDISNVKHIKEKTFYGCFNLESVTLSDDLTYIGEDAFRDCYCLKNVTIPNATQYIGKYAFMNCESLESISLPNTLVEIKLSTFENCTSLKNAYLGNGIQTIEDNAFYNCSALKSIDIPDSVKLLCYSAFSNCASLTDVKIGNGITDIYEYVFANCTSLNSIDFGTRVETICEDAFRNCKGLESVYLPKNIKTIADYSFHFCDNIKDVYYGGSIQDISYLSTEFPNATIHYNYVPEGTDPDIIESGTCGANLTWELDSEGTLTISGEGPMEDYGNTRMFEEDMYIKVNANTRLAPRIQAPWCYLEIKKVVIEEGVTTVGDWAFPYSTEITEVSLPSTITSIGALAFSECYSLKSIELPENLQLIGDSAFYACNSITEITLPKSVTRIGWDVFESCSELLNIYTEKGGSKYVSVDGVLMSVDNALVAYPCGRADATYTILNGTISIGRTAFKGCEALQQVSIPESVETIGDYAFNDCLGLKNVSIPQKVKHIGKQAFALCSSLESIEVATDNANYTSVDDVLFDKEQKTLIAYPAQKTDAFYEVPSKVTAIEPYAFSRNEYLSDVTILYTEKIGDYAFFNCAKLESITLPHHALNIGAFAFWNTAYSENKANWSGHILYIGPHLIMADNNVGVWIVIPYGTISIAAEAFYGMGITSVNIPDTVEIIGNRAFLYCQSLKTVTFTDSVKYIGVNAFDWCDYIETVKYGGTEDDWAAIDIASGNYFLEYADIEYLNKLVIDSGEFHYYCTWTFDTKGTLTISSPYTDSYMIDFNESTALPWEKYDSGIEKVVVDERIYKIGKYGFYGMSFDDLEIQQGVGIIGDYAFYGNDRLYDVNLPDSVTTIGNSAFEECAYMYLFTMGNNVTTIGDNAFYNCYLSNLTLPASVEKIGNDAFYCPVLTDVYYGGSEEDWKKIVIGTGNEDLLNATIHYNCVWNQTMDVSLKEFETDNKHVTLVELDLGEDNNKKKLVVGDGEIYYSVQKDKYIGFVESYRLADNKLTNVIVANEAPSLLVYGNVDGDSNFEDIADAVDTSDLQVMKLAIAGRRGLDWANLVAADVDGDGLLDTSDLQAMKLYLKTNKQFPVLK